MSLSDLELTTLLAQDPQMPIAIVGIACRLPGGASTPDNLWDLLTNKRSTRKEIPPDRFTLDSFYHPDPSHKGTINVRTAHLLNDNLSLFDAPFFSLSPPEARALSPQHRLLLTTIHESLESAGTPHSVLSGTRTACYVASFTRDYTALQSQDVETIPTYLGTGADVAMLANRVSYTFDLRGPSVTVSTACSSGLIALHMACQGIRSGEADGAIVAGANLIFSPDVMVGMTNLHFLSPDGQCYSFDQRANGYARGEGVVSLYIKPLATALRDNDPVRAIIRGSGSNQDGFTNGITVPSAAAQETLIKETYQKAACDPAQVGYFEAHGTGTPAGDPIEASAIGTALGSHRPVGRENDLYVGSIKPNIGHLEAASGLAGVLKAVLALEKGLIPPNINFEKGNEAIDFEGWRIRVPVEVTAWPLPGVRRASVNSFGFGGSNAHVILDDVEGYLRLRGIRRSGAESVSRSPTPSWDWGVSEGDSLTQVEIMSDSDAVHVTSSQRPRVFPWSARDEKAAQAYGLALSKYLCSVEDSNSFLENLSYTLTERRSEFQYRSFVVADTVTSLALSLSTGNTPVLKSDPRSPPAVALVFTGQGAQWYAMGRELYSAYPIFQASINRAADLISSLDSPWTLQAELFKPEKTSLVHAPHISHPLCTALQLALVDLLADWAVTPSVVIGHSSGEIAAAYCAGRLSFDGAIRVSYYRGLVAGQVSRAGAMAAVGLGEREAMEWICQIQEGLGRIEIACYNSSESVTVSGDAAAVNTLVELLASNGIFVRKLKASVAYHSCHMYEVSHKYLSLIGHLEPPSPDKQCPMVSSVTGKLVTGPLSAQYWVDNMLSPVRFVEALGQVTQRKPRNRGARGRVEKTAVSAAVVLEVGPHSALGGPIKQIINAGKEATTDNHTIAYYSCLIRHRNASETLLEAAGSLWCHGVPVSLLKTNNFILKPQVLVALPAYQWSLKPYWSESRLSKNYRFRPASRHHLLGAPVKDWNPLLPRWRNIITLTEQPWLKDHIVQGSVVYPGAGYICMAVAAVAAVAGEEKVREVKVREVVVERALVVPERDEGVEVEFYLRPVGGSWFEFNVFSFTSEATSDATEHCRGLICANEDSSSIPPDPTLESLLSPSYWTAPGTLHLPASTLYSTLVPAGLSYGPTFQNIHSIHINAFTAQTTITVPDTASVMPAAFEYPHAIHPAFLDSIFQSFLAILAESTQAFVPTVVAEMTVAVPPASQRLPKVQNVRAFVRLDEVGPKEATGSFICLGEDGRVMMQGIGIRSVAFGKTVRKLAEAVPRLVLEPVWRADVELLGVGQLEEILNSQITVEDEFQDIEMLDKIAVHFFAQAGEAVANDTVVPEKHRKLWEYINHQLSLPALQPTLSSLATQSPQKLHTLIATLKCSGALPEAVCRIGAHLSAILTGRQDPLSLLSSDNLLTSVYRASLNALRQQAEILVSLLSHKNPNLRILEIGAGTGSATEAILRQLKNNRAGYPRCHSYTFTDVSTAFFATAKEKFSLYKEILHFKKFNVADDPSGQGFAPDEKYDTIIAFCVLHIAPNLKMALQNVHKLLNPSGRLILIEVVTPRDGLCLPFMVLPGWFDSEEDWRPWGPLVPEEKWRGVLEECGFKVGAVTKSCEGASGHAGRLLVAETMHTIPSPITALSPRHPIVPIVIAMGDISGVISPEDTAFTAALIRSLLNAGILDITFRPFATLSAASVTGKIVICSSELSHVIVQNMNDRIFSVFQTVMTEAKGLVWLTRGVFGRAERPEVSLIHGLLRTLRWEYAGFGFLTFDYSMEPQLDPEKVVAALERSLMRLVFGDKAEMDDSEFWEQDGIVHVKRCLPRADYDQIVSLEAKKQAQIPHTIDLADFTTPEPFLSLDRILRLTPGNPLKSSPPVFSVEAPVPNVLPPGHVLVQVRAISVTPRDAMRFLSQLPLQTLTATPGLSFAGTILKSTSPTHPPGTCICGWAAGTPLQNIILTPTTSVAMIPKSYSFAQAAPLPRVLPVALACISFHGKVRGNERMLIWNGAGGLGYAVLQVAEIGEISEVFVAVRAEEERVFLEECANFPAERIIMVENGAISCQKMFTGIGNFDVIVHIDDQDNLGTTLSLIKPGGCLINVTGGSCTSETPTAPGTNLSFTRLARNKAIWHLDTDDITKHPALSGKLETALSLLSLSQHFPCPVAEFPITDIRPACRLALANPSRPIVLTVTPHDTVPISPGSGSLPSYQISSDATYLIIGGLSGIGASLARHLAIRGAKHLILLSRRGPHTPSAQSLLADLTSCSVTVVPLACDVANWQKLTFLLQTTLATLPPLRGIIHGAMVLQDRTFRNMTPRHFATVLSPRVLGAWNLHTLSQSLSTPLDFFVLLSSATGMIGDSGQANYTATNSFLDALAHHRRALGLPASVLDLGMISEVGYIAEESSGAIARNLEQRGYIKINEGQLRGLLELAIYPERQKRDGPQIVTGLAFTENCDLEDPPNWVLDPVFSHVKPPKSPEAPGDSSSFSSLVPTLSISEQLRTASAATSPPDALRTLIADLLKKKLAKTLAIPIEELDMSIAPARYGVDSLVAVEVRGWVMREMGVEMGAFDIIQAGAVEGVVERIVEERVRRGVSE